MSSVISPGSGGQYGFEMRRDFDDGKGSGLWIRPEEETCAIACPNVAAECCVAGIVLRARGQQNKTLEVLGLVSGNWGGEVIPETEVRLGHVDNPLADGTDADPNAVFDLVSESPEALASMRAADFIVTEGCLLEAAVANNED